MIISKEEWIALLAVVVVSSAIGAAAGALAVFVIPKLWGLL